MKAYNVILKILLAILVLYGGYLLWAIIAFGDGCNKMTPERHILPNGYTGKVYIFFDQQEGRRTEYSQNSRVYRIPKSGVLRSKFKPNSGWIDSKKDLNFYYDKEDSLNQLKKFNIPEIDDTVNLDSNTVIVYDYGIGVGWEVLGQGEINAVTYIVDSLKNFRKKDYELTKERFENWDY